jgi:hypothetical protein
MSPRFAAILAFSLALAAGVSTLVAQPPAGDAAKGKGGAPGGAKGKGGTPGKQVAPRAGLFFKENWKQNEGGAEAKLTQANVSDANLELKLYGCGGPEGLLMTGNDNSDANPTHTWTGVCEAPSMFALRHKTKLADLSTGNARIKVNAKTSGFHELRMAVKTADGAWMVSDRTFGTPADFLITEMAFADMRWMRLNAAKVAPTGNILATADLSAIDEIGFVDLMPGSGHGPGGWADVAQIELYANAKPRE